MREIDNVNDFKFDYKIVKLSDIQLDVAMDLSQQECAIMGMSPSVMPVHGGRRVKRILIDGEPLYPTGRFWASLYAKFGLNNAFFKFFDHVEVLTRINEREANDKIRITIERNVNTGNSRLLAATGVNKPVVVYDDLLDIIGSLESDNKSLRYHDGIFVSTHTPRIGQNNFKIAGDDFSNQYKLHCPVDGFGNPSIYLSLLRWICSNGAVGFANAFKTTLMLGSGGDSTRFALKRALDSFANDEGYAMMRSRFEAATRSWASIREHNDLYRTLLNLQRDPVLYDSIKNWDKTTNEEASVSVANSLLKAFGRMAGNPFETHKIDPNMMSDKKRRVLPVQCKVYDMINFATELATHHVSESGARSLQAWVGHMISNDYDLEDSADEFSSWRDVFLSKLSHDKETVTS